MLTSLLLKQVLIRIEQKLSENVVHFNYRLTSSQIPSWSDPVKLNFIKEFFSGIKTIDLLGFISKKLSDSDDVEEWRK